jgi:hypothetical protein
VGQLVAFDESGLGIEATVEADAADAGGESTELDGGCLGSLGPAGIERKRYGQPQVERCGRRPSGARITSVTTSTTWFWKVYTRIFDSARFPESGSTPEPFARARDW